MKKFNYFPIMKTRDAELKAMSKLSSGVFDHILPIYELTKSRKAKIAPDGDIHRRMLTIKDIQGERPFILDLTSNEKYINDQIRQLVDEKDGYYEWRYFINLYNHLNIIPMIHIYDDEDFSEVRSFVSEITKTKKMLALRLPHDLDNYSIFVKPIADSLQDDSKFYVILDAGQVEGATDKEEEYFLNACSDLEMFNDKIEDIIIACTSFPSSPIKYGHDDQGEIPILEEKIFKKISENYQVKYGDYASINIEQIEMKGGTFVPRIDISLEDKFIYKRYRRDAGSYPLCAAMMVKDVRYTPIGIWADHEISLAAKNTPSGISPSFWIAVRMNYFMSTRVLLRN
ncbi:TPA: beta family protein, partial [Escherichia coli]